MDNARKRQRRQTAGVMMQNLLLGGIASVGGVGAAGKKKNSTAQPRPVVAVPPGAFGPVRDPNENDVLSGRGGRINAHTGNVQLRELVALRKKDYLAKTTKKLEKAHIAAEIVHQIRCMNPPGRFLKEEKDGFWSEIGDQKAYKKVGQALREDAPEIRGGDQKSSDEEDNKPSGEGSEDSSSPGKATSSGHSASEEKAPARSKGITVSNRGAKTVAHGGSGGNASKEQQDDEPYQPLAYQEIAPPPSYHPVLPPTRNAPLPQHKFYAEARGGGVSGAAAAAMTQEDNDDNFEVPPLPGDTAFGRPFHPPPSRIVDPNRDSSLVSGLSGPSVMSGLSNISGLSDPISSLSAKSGAGSFGMARSMQQLHQLRQQWAAHQQQQYHQHAQSSLTNASMASSAMTGTRQLLGSANLGSSLGRSTSLTDLNAGMDSISMAGSMADHSLIGGGLGNSAGSGGQSIMSFATMQSVIPVRDMRNPMEIAQDVQGTSTFSSLARGTSGGRNSRAYEPHWGAPYHPGAAGLGGMHAPSAFYPIQQQQQLEQQNHHHDEAASVATMSINSTTTDSLPSMPGSIMSDLSENLIALDLADSTYSLLDQI